MQAVNQAGSATWDPGGGRQGPKADGGRKGGPQTAGDPDLPQTLGPSACAPYPSPMLSEEGELLLDSPALEVSDSESDEVLGAGPEGRGSEAGTWEQVGGTARRGAEAGRGLQPEMGGGRKDQASQAPIVRSSAKGTSATAPASCGTVGAGLRPPLCALVSHAHSRDDRKSV